MGRISFGGRFGGKQFAQTTGTLYLHGLQPVVLFRLWHQIPKTLNRKIQGFFMPAI